MQYTCECGSNNYVSSEALNNKCFSCGKITNLTEMRATAPPILTLIASILNSTENRLLAPIAKRLAEELFEKPGGIREHVRWIVNEFMSGYDIDKQLDELTKAEIEKQFKENIGEIYVRPTRVAVLAEEISNDLIIEELKEEYGVFRSMIRRIVRDEVEGVESGIKELAKAETKKAYEMVTAKFDPEPEENICKNCRYFSPDTPDGCVSRDPSNGCEDEYDPKLDYVCRRYSR